MRVIQKHFLLAILLSLVLSISCSGGKTGTAKKVIPLRPSPPELPKGKLWEFQVGTKLPERMVLYNDEVLLADSIGSILAIKPQDGAQRIALKFPAPVLGWDIQGDLVAASTLDKALYLDNLTTGEVIWMKPCESAPSEPAFTSEGVIIAEGVGPFRIRYHSLKDKHLLWQREFDVKPGGYAAAVGKKAAFIGFEDGVIRALSLADGHTLWEYEVGPPKEVAPDNPWMKRFEFLGQESQKRMGVTPMYPGGITRLIATDTGLLVASEDGHIRLFNEDDGRVVWDIDLHERVMNLWFKKVGKSGLFADTIDAKFHWLDMDGAEKAALNLDYPTFGCVTLDDGPIIIDVDNTGAIITRSLDNALQPVSGAARVESIPVGGIDTNGIIVVREQDGDIAGLRF